MSPVVSAGLPLAASGATTHECLRCRREWECGSGRQPCGLPREIPACQECRAGGLLA